MGKQKSKTIQSLPEFLAPSIFHFQSECRKQTTEKLCKIFNCHVYFVFIYTMYKCVKNIMLLVKT